MNGYEIFGIINGCIQWILDTDDFQHWKVSGIRIDRIIELLNTQYFNELLPEKYREDDEQGNSIKLNLCEALAFKEKMRKPNRLEKKRTRVEDDAGNQTEKTPGEVAVSIKDTYILPWLNACFSRPGKIFGASGFIQGLTTLGDVGMSPRETSRLIISGDFKESLIELRENFREDILNWGDFWDPGGNEEGPWNSCRKAVAKLFRFARKKENKAESDTPPK